MFEVLDGCGVWVFCKYLVVLERGGECSIYWGDGALWGLLAPILANYHY